MLDGRTMRYDGLEPIDATAASITINGGDLGGSTELLSKDLLRVSPYTGGDCTGTCIHVQNFDPTGTFEIAELNFFTVAGTTSVTIDGGLGSTRSSSRATSSSPVRTSPSARRRSSSSPASRSTSAAATSPSTQLRRTTAISLLGITTTIPVLGAEAKIDVDGATLNANDISLSAFSGTLSTTVNGAGQNLGGGTLTVASVAGFANDGRSTSSAAPAPASTRAANTGANQFTGITGCTGTPADGAIVRKDIVEAGSDTGFRHAALELEYYATVDVHGASQLNATGNVALSTQIDVTAKAKAAAGQDRGNWVSGSNYLRARSSPTRSTARSTTRPRTSSTARPRRAPTAASSATGRRLRRRTSSVVASSVIAIARTRLTGTSAIAAPSGTASLTSNLKTNITSDADSSATGSGAGIAVAVLVPTSEAYVDSTAATRSPRPGSRSSRHRQHGADHRQVEPEGHGRQRRVREHPSRANGNSKTGDGNQNLTAALAVTVLVATTAGLHLAGRRDRRVAERRRRHATIHAGASHKTSAIADGGNVAFSPGKPTLTSSAGGSLTEGTTYFYKVTAVFAGNESLPARRRRSRSRRGSGHGTVNLSWTAVAGATGYKVYRGTSSDDLKLITAARSP